MHTSGSSDRDSRAPLAPYAGDVSTSAQPPTEPVPDGPAEGEVPAGRPPRTARRAALVFDDPLDGRSSDDSDSGWGDDRGGDQDDLARFLREKPPHHL